MAPPPFLRLLLSKDTKPPSKRGTSLQSVLVTNRVVPITATEEVAREARGDARESRVRRRTLTNPRASLRRSEAPVPESSTGPQGILLETSQTAFLPNGLLKLPSPCNLTAVTMTEEGGMGSLNSTNTDQQAPVVGASILYNRRRTGPVTDRPPHHRSPQSQSQGTDQRARWRLDDLDETNVPSVAPSRRGTPPPGDSTRRPGSTTHTGHNSNSNSHRNAASSSRGAAQSGALQHVTITAGDSASSQFDSKILRPRRGVSEDAWSSDMGSERYGSDAPAPSVAYSQSRHHGSERSTMGDENGHHSRRVQGAKAVLRRHVRNTSMNASMYGPQTHSSHLSQNGQLHRTWSNSGCIGNSDGRSVTSASYLSRMDSAHNHPRYHRRLSPSPSQSRVPTFPSTAHLEHQVVVTPARAGPRSAGAKLVNQGSGNPLDTHVAIGIGDTGTHGNALVSSSTTHLTVTLSGRRLGDSSRTADSGPREQPLIEMLEVSRCTSHDVHDARRPDSPEALTMAYSGGSESGPRHHRPARDGVARNHVDDHPTSPAAAAAAALIVVAAKRERRRGLERTVRRATPDDTINVTPRRRSRREWSVSMSSDSSSSASYAERHRKNVDKLLAHLGHDTSRSNTARQPPRRDASAGNSHGGASESETDVHSKGAPSRVHSPTTTGTSGWTGIGGGGVSTTEDWYAHLRRKFAAEGAEPEKDPTTEDLPGASETARTTTMMSSTTGSVGERRRSSGVETTATTRLRRRSVPPAAVSVERVVDDAPVHRPHPPPSALGRGGSGRQPPLERSVPETTTRRGRVSLRSPPHPTNTAVRPLPEACKPRSGTSVPVVDAVRARAEAAMPPIDQRHSSITWCEVGSASGKASRHAVAPESAATTGEETANVSPTRMRDETGFVVADATASTNSALEHHDGKPRTGGAETANAEQTPPPLVQTRLRGGVRGSVVATTRCECGDAPKSVVPVPPTSGKGGTRNEAGGVQRPVTNGTRSPKQPVTSRRSSRKMPQSTSLLDTMRHSLTLSYASLGEHNLVPGEDAKQTQTVR